MIKFLTILGIFCVIFGVFGSIHGKEGSKMTKKPIRESLNEVNITISANDSISSAILQFFEQASAMNGDHLSGRIFLVKGFYDEGESLMVVDGTLTKTYDLYFDVNTVRSGYNPMVQSDYGIYVAMSPGSTIEFSGFTIDLRDTTQENSIGIEMDSSNVGITLDQIIFNGVPEAVRLNRRYSSLVASGCKFYGQDINSTKYTFAVAITARENSSILLNDCTISSYHNQYPAIYTLDGTNVTLSDCDISNNIWDNRHEFQPQNETNPLIEVGSRSLLNIWNCSFEQNGGWGHILKVGQYSAIDLQNTSMVNNTVVYGNSVVQITMIPPPIIPLERPISHQVLIDNKYQARVISCDFYNSQSSIEIALNKSLDVLLSDTTFYSDSNIGLLADSLNNTVTVTKCIFMNQPPFKMVGESLKFLKINHSRIYSDRFDPLGCSNPSVTDLSYCNACSGGFQCSDCKGVCVESFDENQKNPIMCYQQGLKSCTSDCLISPTTNSICTCAVVLNSFSCNNSFSGAIAAIVICSVAIVGLFIGVIAIKLDKRAYERRNRFINN